jgi:hypothetical protein
MARWRKVKQGKVDSKKVVEDKKLHHIIGANFLSRTKAFITDMFMI